jgi:alpha-N-arabinofuranosidase
VTLTVVNPHVSEAREAEVLVRQAQVTAVRAVSLTARDLNAHNTFDEPDVVVPRPFPAGTPRGSVVAHRFPPASVTRLTLFLH